MWLLKHQNPDLFHSKFSFMSILILFFICWKWGFSASGVPQGSMLALVVFVLVTFKVDNPQCLLDVCFFLTKYL